MDKQRVLVVDDDREIVSAIMLLLEREGIEAVPAYNGRQAVERLNEGEIHLIIIDIMMPELDGISATIKIRAEQNIPVIMLSAKTEESDKILGLSVGADDYITKPFSPAELVARVKSQLRRYMTLGDYANRSGGSDIILGGLVLHREERQLEADGEPVKLTPKEYRIVELLMSNPGRVFSAEEIYERVWNESAFSVENTIMVHIRRIREKIEINPNEPRYLKVVWGIGYKMEKIQPQQRV
ncbi:MAG: response regulator transcription factor [Oscillospiraceae bacterium]|nr:response regulator transcription factor [Oscillospiraceae bacterium]